MIHLPIAIFNQIIVYLLKSAIYSAPADSTVTVSALLGAKSVLVTVSDTGPGLYSQGASTEEPQILSFANGCGRGLDILLAQSLAEAIDTKLCVSGTSFKEDGFSVEYEISNRRIGGCSGSHCTDAA